jgi:hypothetical protein
VGLELSENELIKNLGHWRFFRLKMRTQWCQFCEVLLTDPSLVGYLARKSEKMFQRMTMLNGNILESEVADTDYKPRRQRGLYSYRFKEGQTVRVKGTAKPCIGIVSIRWIARNSYPCYELQINQSFFCFYEYELQTTKLRVRSKVKIIEFKSKTLSDGTYNVPTKWTHSDYAASDYAAAYGYLG